MKKETMKEILSEVLDVYTEMSGEFLQDKKEAAQFIAFEDYMYELIDNHFKKEENKNA